MKRPALYILSTLGWFVHIKREVLGVFTLPLHDQGIKASLTRYCAYARVMQANPYLLLLDLSLCIIYFTYKKENINKINYEIMYQVAVA